MKEQTKLYLKADAGLPLPINIQLKEQFKWLIGIGIIKSGEILPSANQLAEQLQLNRNTINWVYSQLRDEGIVTMQKGRGTQVLDGAVIEEIKKKRKPLFAFIQQTMKDATEAGFNLEEFLLSSFAYLQLFISQSVALPRMLFVECREHDYPFYRNEIKRLTNAEIKTVFYEDIVSSAIKLEEVLQNVDVVITTLNHSNEVRTLLSDRQQPVITIGATIDTSLLLDIARLKPGSKVGFVCLGNKGGQWMAERVKEAGIEGIVCSSQGTNDKKGLNDIIEKADRIYASAAVYNEIKALAPEKVSLYPMKLEKSSEELLKNYMKDEKSSSFE